jgi:hypothetical protein
MIRRQAMQQRRATNRQRGAALLEFSLAMTFGVLPMVLGILQVTALLVAHDVLSLATFQAARQGAMQGGDASAMRSALARSLLPLYVPVARNGQVSQAAALKGYGLALGEVSTLDRLTIVAPTRESVRGLTIRRGGGEVVPNEALESRPPALQAANLLTLEVAHCQPLVVPVVGAALAQGLLLLNGDTADAACLAIGRIPLKARATVVMQSDLKAANLP